MRKGFTLLEMMVVLAVIAVLSALGVTTAVTIMPSWRTKSEAMKFADRVREARTLAILHDRQTQVEITSFDPNPTTDGDNYGGYTVAVSNDLSGDWDILPYEPDTVAPSGTGEGTHNFGADSKNRVRSVALAEPDVDTITFDPRGMLTNPVADFTEDDQGMLVYTFHNKQDATDHWYVMISRGGMVRLEANKGRQFSSNAGGTETQSTN
ncbi:MAG: prepilin-type N-terminal cleavage/methylation domain-containing protein [Proteobacteria bacterium]|nr:prepilin-type N-terminal cleavage/methylation domain-containing protein [Pseudomonadota bacterium]MCP4919565.1 prepilin-type N-terminal cleavage/methylation domain-containing protein [Pseudomonadota bacterium]